MKSTTFYILTWLFIVSNATADTSNKNIINTLIDTIKNAPSETITAYNIPTTDDCTHTKIKKDGNDFLYKRACFPISLRFSGADPIKDADYTFTVYGDQEIQLVGPYSSFKDLIAILPSPKRIEPLKQQKVSKPKSLFTKSCDPYGFDVTTESDKDITVKYDYGFTKRTFTFPKIFDDNGTKIYFGGDNDIFINKNGTWKNYGHQCTQMRQKYVIQNCDSEHKIKIIWYTTENNSHLITDLAAGSDPWGFSDIALVYTMICQDEDDCKKQNKTPSIFLRKQYDSIDFINNDMWIRYDEKDDGKTIWKTSNNLCKRNITSKNIPDILIDKAISWEKLGFKIEYVGKYKEGIDNYTDIDIYKTVNTDGARTGFPTIYAIHDNKIIKEITGHEAMAIIRKTTFDLFSN